jgi:hypothetical protein
MNVRVGGNREMNRKGDEKQKKVHPIFAPLSLFAYSYSHPEKERE